MSRTVKKPDERRSELIAHAQKLFYSKGYESTSVRDIVSAAGVAKGTFYYYFDSKSAVLEAMVDELIAYSLALLQEIIADDTLDAEQKWNRAITELNNWKVGQKTEMMALSRILYHDENALLWNKIRTKSMLMIAPELAKIIEQGVDERVFETEFVNNSAEIALAVMQTLSLAMVDILLRPGKYENPSGLVRSKVSAVQTAIERVLGASPGSLPLLDSDTIDAWFEDRLEPRGEKVLW